ncbi:unconventional myosin-XIX-like [Amphibalanus amphitrite]|uniref:unconventional myosin-XIX-like n=1 Tax=Amphibalanus amphitrite TaxID=1232801 RepID=UPI001C910B45|nr:unconventional myosin-XIX-like [Amphibalanus amphitrite]XP_043233770.1 unconventional myosin-XIX-like [Amphibalanus amphitrite]
MTETSDLGKLPCVSEESIIEFLKRRLLSKIIYTWAGSNLIAVNPFEDVAGAEDPALNELIRRRDGARGPLPAHVHSIAQTAHHGLQAGTDQTVIISGESGAGKTFSAHRLLHYLVQLEASGSQGTGRTVEQKLNVSNPLLEAFGNARTTNNGNSSRFCKLFRLEYGGGRLRGGAVHTCLFEKTRVMWRGAGERSFHIFYQMVAGLPAGSLHALGLDRHASLSELSGHACDADATDFAVTESAMAELGLSGEQRAAVFAVLAALLHLSRLRVVARTDDQFEVEDDAALQWAARLLGVSAPQLAETLTEQQLAAGRSSVVRRPCQTEQELLARRDCLVRELYDGLFRWLVEWINGQIASGSAAPRAISLLDISGFESLETNSLEQLCINYANERLQQFFLASFLRRLEAAFLEEGLIGARLEYPDNGRLLVALDGPAPSVFGALDEASGLRQVVSASQLSAEAQRAACAAPGAGGEHTFTVRHFCGPVSYDARALVAKNRDRVDATLTALLAGSSEWLVRQLPSPAAAPGTPRGARRRNTVLARLQLSVGALLRRLDGSDVQFVRCVRPNGAGAPGLVADAYMRRQLRAAGVLATARLSAAGFPFRLTPAEFVARYTELVELRQRAEPRPNNLLLTQTIERWTPDDPGVRVGTGHVFLTRGAWYRLGDLCQLARRSAAGRLQRCWRRRRRLRAALHVQRWVRGWLARRRYGRLRAAVTLQRHTRGWLARRQCRRLRAALTLQRCVRAWLAGRRRQRAAAVLQRCYRRRLEAARRHRRDLTDSMVSDGADSGVSCLDSGVCSLESPPGEERRWQAGSGAGTPSPPAGAAPPQLRPLPPDSLLAGKPLHMARGIVSVRHVFADRLPFHTRRTCLPFSCELPRFLVPAGLVDLV